MQKMTLPPLIMASEEGSFAQKTIRERLPQILDWVHISEDLSHNIQQDLQNFKAELVNGCVQPLREHTQDRDIWNSDMEGWIGKKWDQLPWMIAEAFFYRRILEVTRYFQPGQTMDTDPFEPLKAQDMIKGCSIFKDIYPSMNHDDSCHGFGDHLSKALWANRGDLSLIGKLDTSMDAQNHRIILDQSKNAYQHLSEIRPGAIAYFCDNVGKELFFDLAFINYLLEMGLADHITMFVKNQPFFISDVTAKDLSNSLVLLNSTQIPELQQLSSRLTNSLASGKLQIEAPPFLTFGHCFRQMPAGLNKQIKSHDLTILKGDLNYRRLMGDRHWPPTTPVAIAGGYFPTPFLSLRTLKAELIVGLTDDLLKNVVSEGDLHWLTNGKRGLITFHK
jgi:hypothetical protein